MPRTISRPLLGNLLSKLHSRYCMSCVTGKQTLQCAEPLVVCTGFNAWHKRWRTHPNTQCHMHTCVCRQPGVCGRCRRWSCTAAQACWRRWCGAQCLCHTFAWYAGIAALLCVNAALPHCSIVCMATGDHVLGLPTYLAGCAYGLQERVIHVVGPVGLRQLLYISMRATYAAARTHTCLLCCAQLSLC